MRIASYTESFIPPADLETDCLSRGRDRDDTVFVLRIPSQSWISYADSGNPVKDSHQPEIPYTTIRMGGMRFEARLVAKVAQFGINTA